MSTGYYVIAVGILLCFLSYLPWRVRASMPKNCRDCQAGCAARDKHCNADLASKLAGDATIPPRLVLVFLILSLSTDTWRVSLRLAFQIISIGSRTSFHVPPPLAIARHEE